MGSINKYITILGKVNVNTNLMLNLTGDWYFIDYSENCVPIGTQFWFNDNYATLNKVILDASKIWNCIEKGYKCICQFTFIKPFIIEEIVSWSKSNHSINFFIIDINKLREEKLNKILNN